MKGYQGEFPVDVKTHPKYSKYTKEDWALHWIYMYGQIDGGHHKQWVLDQVVQILNGSEVIVIEAKWDSGHKEDRFRIEPSEKYHKWVKEYEYDEEEDEYYEYDAGIAP